MSSRTQMGRSARCASRSAPASERACCSLARPSPRGAERLGVRASTPWPHYFGAMEYQHLVTGIDAGVLTVTMNRPEVLNSCNRRMAGELREVFETAGSDDAVRAVLLTGAGRAFCAGQDLAEAAPPDGTVAPDIGDIVRGYNALILAVRRLEKPVVAAV